METNVLDELNKRLAELPKDTAAKFDQLLKKAKSTKEIQEDFEILGFKIDEEFAKALYEKMNGTLDDEQLEQVAGGGEIADLIQSVGELAIMVGTQSKGLMITQIASPILQTVTTLVDKKLRI